MAVSENTEAMKKLRELLHCGNERVELSAAKELLAMEGEPEDTADAVPFTVEIRVVDGNG